MAGVRSFSAVNYWKKPGFLPELFSTIGNALSGAFDVRFRKGNTEKAEFTGQAGIIGIDLATEGPFSKNHNSSYLVNYRYSTVGLLSQLGVDLGEEKITFQDISFNICLPSKKWGEFSIFGISGLSSNEFLAPRDSAKWKNGKDRHDIQYSSEMGALGITHQLHTGNNTFLRTVITASGINSMRTAKYIRQDLTSLPQEKDELSKGLLSAHSYLRHSINNRNILRIGLTANNYQFDLRSQHLPIGSKPVTTIAKGKGNTFLLEPYLNWTHFLSSRFTWNAGLHGMYFTLNGSKSLEPRTSLKWSINRKNILSAGYGLQSRLQLLRVYFTRADPSPDQDILPNKNLGFTKAHHVAINYAHIFNNVLKISFEPYYQFLFNVPVEKDPGSSFSALNLFEGHMKKPLTNKGTGENYGIDITFEKYFSGNYYFMFSGSYYQSKYRGADKVKRDTRYNGEQAASFTGGKEWIINKKHKTWMLGLNTRIYYRGGYKRTPIDLQASQIAGKTITRESRAFALDTKDYFRVDLQWSIKKNKPGVSQTFYIDIQNLTNRKNLAFYYYDPLNNRVLTKHQLGIIPMISYRIEL